MIEVHIYTEENVICLLAISQVWNFFVGFISSTLITTFWGKSCSTAGGVGIAVFAQGSDKSMQNKPYRACGAWWIIMCLTARYETWFPYREYGIPLWGLYAPSFFRSNSLLLGCNSPRSISQRIEIGYNKITIIATKFST